MNHASLPTIIGAIPRTTRIAPRRKPMPLIAASLTIPVLATALSLPAAALVIDAPRQADMYSVLGAILASLIALIEARYKGRDSVSYTHLRAHETLRNISYAVFCL